MERLRELLEEKWAAGMVAGGGAAADAVARINAAGMADGARPIVFSTLAMQDVRDAVEHCLGDAHERPPAAKTAEKKGVVSIGGSCGSILRTLSTFESNWPTQVARSRCASIAT
mgnify:CR=1 FL=1